MSGQPLDTELLDAKAIKALRNEIGDGAIKEFVAQSDEELKAVISNCTMAIDEAERQTQKNDAFSKANGVVNDFKAALRSTKQPLTKKIKAAAYVLGSRKDSRS